MTSFTIVDARIFTGDAVIAHGHVVVQDGLITTVASGNPSETDAAAAPIISAAGHTLLPGLIDAHVHCHGTRVSGLERALRFGVTTVMDMHNERDSFMALKTIAARRKDLADFKCAGRAATIDGGWPAPVVLAKDSGPWGQALVAKWVKLATPDDARAFVTANIADGADYIKLMQEGGAAMGHTFTTPSLELQTAVVQAAHVAGKVAVAHALALDDTLLALRAGVDGMTHTFYDRAPTAEVIDAYKQARAWCNPTLVTIGSLTGEGRRLAERFAHDPRVQHLIGEGERGAMCECMKMTVTSSKTEYAYETVRRLLSAGIDIVW